MLCLGALSIGNGCVSDGGDAPAAEETAASELVSQPEADSNIVIGPQQCGRVTCTGNTRCCNASCGTCVPPGGECTDQICVPTD